MNDSIEQENRHSLHAINQQLLFNGYQSIFNEENSQIDEEKLKQILGKVLRNENDLQRRVTESLDEHRKTQADLKRALVKGESLQQEIHQLERHLAEVIFFNFFSSVLTGLESSKSSNIKNSDSEYI